MKLSLRAWRTGSVVVAWAVGIAAALVALGVAHALIHFAEGSYP